MEKQKISVVINTYNAALRLREVLDAVKDFDEILVCDMESTDETLQIAAEYGCRIVTFPRGKHNIVEPAREFAIHRAQHPWVLVVDADEIVTPELRDYLYAFTQGGSDGLLIPRKNFFMGRFMRCLYPDYILASSARTRPTGRLSYTARRKWTARWKGFRRTAWNWLLCILPMSR